MSFKVKAWLFVLLLIPFGNANSHQTVSMTKVYADVLIYRPIGLATTITGTAIFAAMSPFLAIANLAEPHEAFADASHALIQTPFEFTFERPLGILSPDADGVYRRH